MAFFKNDGCRNDTCTAPLSLDTCLHVLLMCSASKNLRYGTRVRIHAHSYARELQISENVPPNSSSNSRSLCPLLFRRVIECPLGPLCQYLPATPGARWRALARALLMADTATARVNSEVLHTIRYPADCTVLYMPSSTHAQTACAVRDG